MLESIEPTDESLAVRVADGDAVAFATLYDRYSARVYAWASRLLGASDADDVTQEVFVKVWDRARQFDPARGRFASWFGAIARNHILSLGRRRGRERRVLAADAIDELLASTPDPAIPVESRVWLAARDVALAAAVHALPAEQRRAIVLAYFGGLSQSEIAAVLAVPLGTVKKRTRLALAKLRRALVADGSEQADTG
jgi:RNA polymerase sigma-70 factor (ECF subfamily)